MSKCGFCFKDADLVRIWSPLWPAAAKGPIEICWNCIGPVDNVNPLVFFGHYADAAFSSVEAFIPGDDERYDGAMGMMKNGTVVRSSFPYMVSIVDGKVWLANWNRSYPLMRLGNYPEVKRMMPSLFAAVGKQMTISDGV